MNCYVCQIMKIGPQHPPFGCFMCSKGHLQCNQCNIDNNGKCIICKTYTSFLQICHNALPTNWMNMAQGTNNEMPTDPSTNLLRNVNECETESMFTNAEMEERLTTSHFYKTTIHSVAAQVEVSKEIKTEDTENAFYFEGCLDQQQYDPHGSTMKYEYTNTQTCMPLEYNENNAFEPGKISQGFSDEKDNDTGINKSFIIETGIDFRDSADTLKNVCMKSTSQLVTHKSSHLNNGEINGLQMSSEKTVQPQRQTIKQNVGLCMKMFKNVDKSYPEHYREFTEHHSRIYGPMHNNQRHPSIPMMPTNVNVLTETQKDLKSMGSQSLLASPIHNNNANNNTNKEEKKEISVLFQKHEPIINRVTDLKTQRCQPNEFLIKPGVIEPKTYLAKTITDKSMITNKLEDAFSFDERWHKILETLQEDTELQKIVDEKINQNKSKNIISKIPTNVTTTVKKEDDKETSDINKMEDKGNQKEENKLVPTTKQQENLHPSGVPEFQYFVNVHRACYNAPSLVQRKPTCCTLSRLNDVEYMSLDLPPAQFEQYPCSKKLAEILSIEVRYLSKKPIDLFVYKISRTPIKCPDTECERLTFVTDLNRHLMLDHTYLTSERIKPFECRTFFLDTRLSRCGTTKCHALYLMKDKVKNFSSEKYRDLLPLLVLSSKINLAEICSLNNEQTKKKSNSNKSLESVEFLLVWLTGMEEIPISYTLTVWANTGPIPKCHIVYSDQIYPIRNPQKGIDVYNNSRVLILTPAEINVLTKGGTEMLQFQITVH